jgi:NAD(P)-dependent dehydrogenase (short-subunit alcohol dehydrogenase family)
MAEREFAGKVVLVTGGSSGLGRATAIAFAAAGATVAIADIADAGGHETVAMIEQAGEAGLYIHADMRSETDIENMVAETAARFGRLDFAYNNAGISGSAAPDEFWDSAIFDDTFAINARGVYLCMKYEVAQLLKQEGDGSGFRGAIVNTASVAGMTGSGHPSYNGSKHAVIGITKNVAMRYATQGIRVNAVCPGAIDTPMVQNVTARNPENAKLIARLHPMNRIGQPNEVADAVLFLCSARASFITGHPLAVDGGTLAR